MDTTLLIALAVIMIVVLGAALVWAFLQTKDDDNRDHGRRAHRAGLQDSSTIRRAVMEDESGGELEAMKNKMRKGIKKKAKLTLEERYFQAGLFYQQDKEFFNRFRLVAPIVSVVTAAIAGMALGLGSDLFLFALFIGGAIGYQIPFSWLDRRILQRSEDILYYLPLVIEQIVVGVSSSLDIGPCLAVVVEMADERKSHNPVTELIKRTQFFIKQGVPLEEAMTEIGKLSYHTELKHAFISLSQVARHGGEVSKQLQELADSVQTQRETKIDAKIKKLELEATGPVAFVFAGFLLILLVEFGLQVFKAFS